MWVPTDTKRVRRKYTRFSSKGPPLSAFRMYGSPKDGKMLLKENSNGCFPITGSILPRPRVPGKTVETDHVYSVLTALHSAFFPKVTQMRCHHSRQMDPDTRREIDRRLSITQAQTPTGTTFQFINIYQFTAANPTGQTNMWTTTENWINKQKNNLIIMQGDLNCAHPGCRWDYA